ncbi:hypothetical protein NF867_04860 [Solitalea sp. MAHUQ-68]|uniref:Uncharacterized protein n=1 Tax=Solitalea agri TaxID=2953739 RepID=A0A9X2F177_9SPHI|nr:hypothetical protein [Solitalea agri]MCO4292190.1 hypothetical protein [Solitalea agri]
MLEDLKPVKYYAFLLIAGILGYSWFTMNGIKILGDDNQSKENKSGYTRSYYHK